ncbi:monovalent cation/H+ antiporter complex subunit F [Stella sp.]|uniref:monovalent cation/H+ antiporter complex subunit F n=1 Tax=Stella sp. TaxID=2912054 RepID=UPI0035AE3A0B
MTIVAMAATAAACLVGLALIGVAWRLLAGPSAADRVIATDMLGLLAIAIAALAAVLAGHAAFLDVAFAIALFGFLGAVAFAGLLERASRSPDGSE